MSVVFDWSNLAADRVGGRGGVPATDVDGRLADRFRDAMATLRTWRDDGRLGFLDLPDEADLAAEVGERVAAWTEGAEDVLILGIGGSALGAVVLRDALGGVRWNASAALRGDRPRLHVVDNPDPDSVRSLLADLDPARTAVNVVSKSGSTAETMALYLVVRAWMMEGLGGSGIGDGIAGAAGLIRRRLLITTDPERGVLRPMAEREGIAALPIPPDVGGRFSVLSAVGLVPAAVVGSDPAMLLAGAAEMREACLSNDLRTNPAGLFATLLHALHTEHGRPIHVFMPYADRLRPLALWFQQLWAESLGKAGRGPTPLPALGAVDQHAQVQLFMEGPHDKVVVFVTAPFDAEIRVAVGQDGLDGLRYLDGRGLGELLDAERRATTEALRRGGRPSATLELASIDEHALGGLLMLLEVATVLAGALYGVDPLDQPGVEQGKLYTYGLMGREGFDAPEFPPVDTARRAGARHGGTERNRMEE
jgi:glucose-6-phosphate isomerase